MGRARAAIGMSESRNIFGWSFDEAMAFEECPRKRFWAVYAAEGLVPGAGAGLCARASRLRGMTDRDALKRLAVKRAVEWIIGEQRAGRLVGAEEAYEAVARPLLNEVWLASTRSEWRVDPAKACLHEHYYPALHADLAPDWPALLREQVLASLVYFVEGVCPRLGGLDGEDEVLMGHWAKMDADPCAVRVCVDYGYRDPEGWCLHEWIAGPPAERHLHKAALGVWWVHRQYGVVPDSIRYYLEYLEIGQVAMELGSGDLIRAGQALVAASVRDMADYLEREDIRVNRPLPREEWDMTPDRSLCELCAYYELCKPEF